jgi:hypothetical protein
MKRTRLGLTMLCAVLLGTGMIAAQAVVRGDGSSKATDPARGRERVLTRLSVHNQQRVSTLRLSLAKGTDEAADDEIEGHPAAAVAAFLRSAKVLQESARMINRDEIQAVEFATVARDPAVLALGRSLAIDPALAGRLYGQDQALVRVAAVRTLTHLPRNGRPELVGEAVDALGQKLNGAGIWHKGIEHDYADLLTGHIQAVGKAEILRDPEAFFERIHLSPRIRAQVGQAFFASGFQAAASPEEMARMREAYRHYVPVTGGG